MATRSEPEGRWMFYPVTAFPPVPVYSGMKKVYPSTEVASPVAGANSTPQGYNSMPLSRPS